MAAADIFKALGAALQTGVGTFGHLTEQEDAKKVRDRQLEIQQKNADRAHELDVRQLEGSEKDRQMRILMAAIEGAQPGAEISPELFKQAQEFGLENRFNTVKSGTLAPSGGSGGPFGVPANLPILQDRHTRAATLQEKGVMNDMRAEEEARDNRNIFQTWMKTEGAEADHDTRVAKAAGLGQQAPPMSAREQAEIRAKERAADQAFRLRELGIMYPPDRFGADGKVGGAGTSRTKVWDQNYNIIADNVRAKYSAELGSVSRAVAEGTAPPEALDTIRQRIDAETQQMMTSRFGERPVDTGDLINTIDQDAQQAQGYWNLYRIVKSPESQALLKAKGVDVKSYLEEVRRKADAEATDFNSRNTVTGTPRQ
jgi:hypothetical protein